MSNKTLKRCRTGGTAEGTANAMANGESLPGAKRVRRRFDREGTMSISVQLNHFLKAKSIKVEPRHTLCVMFISSDLQVRMKD